MKYSRKRWERWCAAVMFVIFVQTGQGAQSALAQTNTPVPEIQGATTTVQQNQPLQRDTARVRYVDETAGMTVDEAVRYALAHHGELLAARKEVDAARARVRQSGLKPNPMIDVSRSEQIGGSDNNTMIGASLPLELGGRRSARVSVTERELELRERMLENSKRLLAAEVRVKYGTALAEIRKLDFTQELLAVAGHGHRLVAARVTEGRTAPLEQNMTLVELNRVRSMRELDEGRVEVALFELRNTLGMNPDEPLRLRGAMPEVSALEPALLSLAEATQRALRERPDLRAARAAEDLASAQIEQARAGGRIDARLTAQYQRNNFGFPVQGINSAGQLAPVQDVFHSVTAGVSLELPIRNKNQGAIEAAAAEAEAARRRREFMELTVRREVAVAYARHERAARALEIFRTGVRGEASENLNVVRETYELGAKTLLDFIAEQRRFIETENGYTDALLGAYLARVGVESASSSPALITR